MDQAAVLRKIRNGEKQPYRAVMARMPGGESVAGGKDMHDGIRVISITSGKGGVGKTHISANLAYIFSRMQKRTLILDADMGLANIDVVLGLAPKFNMHHVLRGEKALRDVLVKGPGDISILPSASGIQEMANLTTDQKRVLMGELDGIDEAFDFMLIDTAAGIASNVMYFNMAAQEIIVVVTPEPTSLTDAYALIKLLYQGHNEKRIMVLVNMAKSAHEAKEVFKRLSKSGILEGSLYYHYARLIEALYAAEKMKLLLQNDLICSKEIWATSTKYNEEGVGVIEAPRGTLFHHYWIDPASGLIRRANLIVATGHNNAAMNVAIGNVARNFIKKGKVTEGILNRVEAAIRCYDPCLSCASHALGQMPLRVEIVSASGEITELSR